MLITGIVYTLLGLVCLLAPSASAENVGFALQGGQGMSEFITVYGGLELGLGLGLLVGRRVPELAPGMLYLTLWISAALVLARGATLVFVDGAGGWTWAFWAAEILIFAVLWWSRHNLIRHGKYGEKLRLETDA